MSDNKRVPILVIQGSQYGSEGKGQIAAWLCVERNIRYAVRTGGVNAGHTVQVGGESGVPIYMKMQQIPTGWINPNTQLVIGAGAYINPTILGREIFDIEKIYGAGYITKRLAIDYGAGLHNTTHEERARFAGRHYKIGATGKGVSEAIVEKISGRGTTGQTFHDWWLQRRSEDPYGWMKALKFTRTDVMLNMAYDDGESILIEGTQGTLLDMHLGPYPYTTNKQTTAANWVTEAGLSPNLEYEIVAVVRTYPIRVAGNSGPMPGEISWPILAQEMNGKLAARGMGPFIRPEDIAIFEGEVVRESKNYQMPRASNGLDQHQWSGTDRLAYQRALSEIHAGALKNMKEGYPAAYEQVCRLFEFTTVTQKLRRIARISEGELRRSFHTDRPSWVALTFLNYELPWLWGETDLADMPLSDLRRAAAHLNDFEIRYGVPVRLVSTGPQMKHISIVPVHQP